MTEEEKADRYLSDSERYEQDSESARYNTFLYRAEYPLKFVRAILLALILWRVW